MARLRDKYKKDIVPALAKKFGRENVLSLPRLTKIVLNMLTTGAMVRIGKTYGNLMVDVQTG